MSDQGRWFKLHGNCLFDQALEELSLEDFARWVRMGVYLKVQGTLGSVSLRRPAQVLQRILRSDSYDHLVKIIRDFPNCTVDEDETTLKVTFRNWHRYQGNMSTDRVRAWRQSGTPRNRRMKRAKNKSRSRTEVEQNHPHRPPVSDQIKTWFEAFWMAYPRKIGKGAAWEQWRRLLPTQEFTDQVLRAVEAAKGTEQWTKDEGRFIPHPLTWLKQSRWEDSYEAEAGGKSAKVRKLEEKLG